MMRCWFVVAVVACSAPKAVPPTNGSGSTTVDKTMKPDGGGSATTFEKATPVVPTEQLIAWLEGQKLDGKARLLRFPIVLTKGAAKFDTSKARLGADPAALVVYANDSALGNGLADRAMSACKGQPTCAFWVEGYWRGKQDLGYQVDVMKVQSTIAPGDLAGANHVQVEGETGN